MTSLSPWTSVWAWTADPALTTWVNTTEVNTTEVNTTEVNTTEVSIAAPGGLSNLLTVQNRGVVSAETRDLVEYVLGCILTQVAIVMGLPGNVLSMVVFCRQGLRDRINLLLFSLAVVDFFNLATYAPVRLACFITRTHPVLAQNWKTVLYPHLIQLNLFTMSLSFYLGTLLSVDRCISVCMPLKAKTLLQFKHAVAIILSLTLLIFAIYVPTLFYSTIVWVVNPATNATMAVMRTTPFFNSQSGQRYHAFEQGFIRILNMACLCVIALCSSATVVMLRRASNTRSQMSDSKAMSSAEKKITKMLLCVSLILAVSIVPSFVGVTATMIQPEFFFFKRYHNLAMVNAYLIYFASALNSSVNFYLYLAMSAKFRATLHALCPCRRLGAAAGTVLRASCDSDTTRAESVSASEMGADKI